jgi:hypothetical protein
MADILKVDWELTTLEERAASVKKHGPWRCRMPAEKVENHSSPPAIRALFTFSATFSSVWKS